MTTKSAYSSEVSGAVGAAEPNAPTIESCSILGNTATLIVILPTTSVDGAILPLASLTALYVYADVKSFVGRLEELLGMEPQAKVDLAGYAETSWADNLPKVSVPLTGLSFNTTYYFTACVE